jgi:integrase
MEEFFSPEEIRALMSRCESDRQRIILFLLYNYGLTIDEALELKAGQFIVKPDLIRFNFTRKLTGKAHSYKIQFENYRLFYRVLNKLQDHEPLLHKDKNLPISDAMIKKDLFDMAVTLNRKITSGQLFDSHLYWLFRRGVSFAQAVEEYGLTLSGKPFKVWENAMLAGRLWPFLLE